MTQWLLFVFGSILITAVSRKSLLEPGSHGFYRFFAWEAILGSLALNLPYWFYHPFAWNQVIAWLLLIASLIPLGLGIRSLRSHGQPARSREGDPSLLAFEETTQLVTSGIYRYIRHPLYSSLLLLTWGIFLKSVTAWTTLLACASTLFLFFTAKADEAECMRFFGQPYAEYMRRTRMFIPYIF